MYQLNNFHPYMLEGYCHYSGLPIIKGRGRYKVTNDGKCKLYDSMDLSKKDDKKIKSTSIPWTQAYRIARKKIQTEKKVQQVAPVVIKIVRGFPNIPAHVIEARLEAKKQRDANKPEKKEKSDVKYDRKHLKVSKAEMRKRQ